jgi:hypothetical protein
MRIRILNEAEKDIEEGYRFSSFPLVFFTNGIIYCGWSRRPTETAETILLPLTFLNDFFS